MKRYVTLILAIMLALLCLTGCGLSKEERYMKKYDGKIVELAPEEIFIKQEGVEYAEFEKFTYFSTYANRESRVNVLLPPN
ncbi:MAG: hypothetical protein IJX54_01105, partial [Oscillospiraceae bacterium]|nr:hypothetical protein [Oscillospiraceae bacterium]